MIRGTTPLLSFGVPFEPKAAKDIYITFAQNGKEVFTVEKKDCTFEYHTINVTLTQAQTLSFTATAQIQIQIRVTFTNGDKVEAMASDIITTTVQRILKEGEI